MEEVEIWKDIPGFGFYQASNLGNIRNGKTFKVLNPGINERGYLCVNVYYPTWRNPYNRKVSRLVALAWKENPSDLPEVNHDDGNKLNNREDNLSWTNRSGNIQHAYDNGLRTCDWIKAVRRISVTGETKVYNSISDALKEGFNHSCITMCCNGIRKQHKKYRWEFIH